MWAYRFAEALTGKQKCSAQPQKTNAPTRLAADGTSACKSASAAVPAAAKRCDLGFLTVNSPGASTPGDSAAKRRRLNDVTLTF